MSRMLKPTVIAILASPAFAIASGTLQQQPANASTTFCNRTNSKVYVAYARGETYAGQANQSVSDAPTDYLVIGWWGLDPGACARVTNESANQVVRVSWGVNNLYSVSHRYYARAVDANNYWTDTYWAGNQSFCVRDAGFNYRRSIGFVFQPLVCSDNYYEAGFRSYYSTATDLTLNLLP